MEKNSLDSRKNILFSTTRQWNPGDEFILMGILNVMSSIDDNFNPIIFNRNPEIERPKSKMCFNFQFDLSHIRFKRLKSGFYDNSFKDRFLQDRFIDLAVFAGTPEWASPRLKSMYQYIYKYSIPTVYIGIGLGSSDFTLSKLDYVYKNVIKNAKLIIVRDQFTKNLLSGINSVFLPCPSLLAATKEFEKNIREVKKVGLTYCSDKSIRNNRINHEAYRFTVNLYKSLLEKYAKRFDFEFICHYVDELPDFFKDFNSCKCNYSYDSRDYIKIYNKFDLVIGTRVHGIGLSASMGIPGISIRHDVRGDTCGMFGAEIIEVGRDFDGVFAIFDAKVKEIKNINQNLLEHKGEVFQQYLTLLSPILKSI